MLSGGALPPLHPTCWPAFGRREISGASPFGRLVLIMIIIIVNNNREKIERYITSEVLSLMIYAQNQNVKTSPA